MEVEEVGGNAEKRARGVRPSGKWACNRRTAAEVVGSVVREERRSETRAQKRCSAAGVCDSGSEAHPWRSTGAGGRTDRCCRTRERICA